MDVVLTVCFMEAHG